MPLAHIHSLVSSIMRYHVVASQLVAPDVALFFLTEKESPSAETKAVFFLVFFNRKMHAKLKMNYVYYCIKFMVLFRKCQIVINCILVVKIDR